MKWIANKTFPHPVLSNEASPPDRDYVGREFQATPVLQIVPDSQLSRLNMSFALSEESLRALVAAGKAKYAAEIHCRETFLRRLLTSDKPQISADFSKGELHRRVEISSYIVCTESVRSHASPNFHPEFGEDAAFDFKGGDVLATAYPSVYWIEQDPERALGTIFELKRIDKNRGMFGVELDDENIRIVMHEEDAKKFHSLQNSRDKWPALLASVYLCALCEALRAMATTPEEYDARIWFGVVGRELDNLGVSLSPQSDVLDIAQKLLEYPAHAMLGEE